MSYGFYTDLEFLLPNGEIEVMEDLEFEVEVDHYQPGSPADFRGNPDNWSAPEDAELDYRITLDGREITDAEFRALGGDPKKVQREMMDALSRRGSRY